MDSGEMHLRLDQSSSCSVQRRPAFPVFAYTHERQSTVITKTWSGVR